MLYQCCNNVVTMLLQCCNMKSFSLCLITQDSSCFVDIAVRAFSAR